MHVSRAARLTLAAFILAAVSGCTSTVYLLQAANGEWHVIHGRKPIVQVIDDPQTPQSLIRELAAVREARDFASRQLDLPDNDSYRTYVKIDRPYVVWNVVAAPVLSVQPKEWCFPIAGCVAYRGYFKEKRAQDFAARLKQSGYDVVIEGVPAYSTLGKLPDPVMSTMLRYGSDELASMIFHELAHQLLYVQNDSRFDEAFAVTVEDEGLKRWLEYKGRSAHIARWRQARAEDEQFVTLLRHARDQLARLYASSAPRAAKLRRKQQLFAGLAVSIRALEHRLAVRFPEYDQWITAGLNNAELVSVGTYNDCVPGFERLLHQEDDDLPRFYDAARKLARESKATRDAQLCPSAASLTATAADPAAQTPAARGRSAASAPSL
jgi:predicted aminopeptidase